jgi:hypothetical protein
MDYLNYGNIKYLTDTKIRKIRDQNRMIKNIQWRATLGTRMKPEQRALGKLKN